MKWFFKWLFRLFLLAVVSIVILLLSLNSILRVYVEHRIRAQTGMDAEIGKFSVGLTEPTVTIQNFKLYNPPDFGGTPFLDIREIHVEYDRAYENAAEEAERLLARAGQELAPKLLNIYPAIIWEDQDECLEVRPEDVAI